MRNRAHLPDFTERQVLAWADAHHRRTGGLPTADSGPIGEAPGETWTAVDSALSKGIRGFSGGLSLAQHLAQERGVRNRMRLSLLTHAQILQWADAHHERTGRWPTAESGPILEAPEESCSAIQLALYHGRRGLSPDILRWAEAHCRRTGCMPNMRSDPVLDAPGETWLGIDAALRLGHRGLPPGASLRLLLQRRARTSRGR
jgi:hypothetical protein